MAFSFDSPYLEGKSSFTPKLQLAVMASGKGSNFESIVTASLSNKIDAEIKCLIVNNANSGAAFKATKYKIPLVILDHKEYGTREEYDNKIVSILHNYNVEAVIMAGWMRIVTSILIKEYPGRILNIHPSILPSFPGINAVRQALKSGVKITGCTVHIVEEKVDNGPIIIQSAVNIESSDTEITLLKKIQRLEHKVILDAISIAGKQWRL